MTKAIPYPKKPLNARQVFCKDKQKQIILENPDWMKIPLSKRIILLTEEWDKLSGPNQKVFHKRADHLRFLWRIRVINWRNAIDNNEF